jgi:hypothetical protein
MYLAEGQAQQDKQAGDGKDQSIDIHKILLT